MKAVMTVKTADGKKSCAKIRNFLLFDNLMLKMWKKASAKMIIFSLIDDLMLPRLRPIFASDPSNGLRSHFSGKLSRLEK